MRFIETKEAKYLDINKSPLMKNISGLLFKQRLAAD